MINNYFDSTVLDTHCSPGIERLMIQCGRPICPGSSPPLFTMAFTSPPLHPLPRRKCRSRHYRVIWPYQQNRKSVHRQLYRIGGFQSHIFVKRTADVLPTSDVPYTTTLNVRSLQQFCQRSLKFNTACPTWVLRPCDDPSSSCLPTEAEGREAANQIH